MRALSNPSDPFFQPLDVILGTQGAVRVLRALSRRGSVLSTSLVASRARINRAGAGRTLAKLVSAGIVEVVGQGRYVSYRLNHEHAFAEDLVKMFRREVERVEGLYELIRTIAHRMDPVPIAVWLLGTEAQGDDEAVELSGSGVELILVDAEQNVEQRRADLKGALDEYGDVWGLEITLAAIDPRQIRRWISEKSRSWSRIEERAIPVHGAGVRQVVMNA